MDIIVHSLEPVMLVGGGPVGESDLSQVLTIAPTIVAADGGAVPVIEAGLMPYAVTGDFDSLPKPLRDALPDGLLHHTPDQNYTDFDKALRLIDAPVVVAVGCMGGRVDHQLAAFHSLVARCNHRCVLVGPEEIVFHCPKHIDLPTQAGDVVSLFPMARVTGRSDGLKWPIEGLDFAPDVFVGTSNRATGPSALHMDVPGMLVILPRRMLAQVTQRLADLPQLAQWPARAAQYTDPPQS
ncbi:MAG: thiamine diphosphokinase [Ascidiaceihabitans sp.]